jgi:hypothetical protein
VVNWLCGKLQPTFICLGGKLLNTFDPETHTDVLWGGIRPNLEQTRTHTYTLLHTKTHTHKFLCFLFVTLSVVFLLPRENNKKKTYLFFNFYYKQILPQYPAIYHPRTVASSCILGGTAIAPASQVFHSKPKAHLLAGGLREGEGESNFFSSVVSLERCFI